MLEDAQNPLRESTNTSHGNRPVEPIGEEEISWMRIGEISIKSEGDCNVLVVAPHGHEEDDTNTEILSALLAEKLNSYAVVNNRAIRRSRGKEPNERVSDLNDPHQARKVQDFWLPLIDRIRNIIRFYPKPPVVIFVHGMDDTNADEHLGEGGIFALGCGYAGKYDATKATASRDFVTTFKRVLGEKVGPARDDVARYSARSRVPTVLQEEMGGHAIEAVQLEIRNKGFRDTRVNLNRLAEQLTDVFLHHDLAAFVTRQRRNEPMSPEELESAREDLGELTRSLTVGDVDSFNRKSVIREPASPEQIKVDSELRRLIHDLSPAERQQLEQNVLKDGCLEPLSVWEHEGKLILLDGHHRLAICKEHGIPFDVTKIDIKTRADAIVWMVEKQTGQRRLSKFSTIELLQPYERILSEDARERQREAYLKRGKGTDTEEAKPERTREIMARKAGVSAGLYQTAKALIAEADDDLKEQLRKEQITISAAHKVLQKSGNPKGDAKANKLGEEKAPRVQEENRPSTDLPAPCDVLVIKKGWENSAEGFNRVANLPVPNLTKEDCTLWLWVSVKYLPEAFSILNHWGLTFKTIVTWAKPTAEPGEVLKEQTDYCLVATKGNPRFDPERAFGTWLHTKEKTNTQDPVGFFTLVEQFCLGESRLEIFAEAPRKGWIPWPPLPQAEQESGIDRTQATTATDSKENTQKESPKKGRKPKSTDTQTAGSKTEVTTSKESRDGEDPTTSGPAH